MQADEGDGIHISRQLCGPRDVTVSSSCPAELQRLGPWRVEDFDLHKRLYQGKASLLYRATCKQSQVPVAVKVYRKARLSELNWFQVEREIRIHSRLFHDNIIQLYAAFEDDSNVYMVQEYATGGDLYEDLKQKGGRFEETCTAAHVLRPCISALMYLHSRGIIHRDIKPENILLMADRSIKLADFGLSIDATSERPVTRAGTLDYMAPEVLLCPEKSRPQENKDKVLLGYTAMVDAWAMGILAYELIVGRPPFEKQSRAATYEHIMYRKPEFPPQMSPDAKDFVFTALTKAARKRPALANMLSHRWLQPLTPPSTSPSSAPSSAPCQQMVVSATLLPGPPGPPLLTAAPTEPSSSGLTPTEAPGLQSMNPHPDEDRHHGGVSRNATAFEVMSISSESMAAHSESRLLSGSTTLTPPAGPSGQPGAAQVSAQRSFQDRTLSNPPSTSSSRQTGEEFETSQRQPTWTASLKRSMLKMISKGSSSSSRDSKTIQDAAAAAVASVNRTSVSSNQATAVETSSGGSRGLGGSGGVSLNVRGNNMRPQHVPSFKGSAHSPSSALLSPIGSQTLSQTSLLGSSLGSQDISVRSGKRAQRSSSVGMSSLDAEPSQTRLPKPSLDPPSLSGQGKPWPALASAASLPVSGLKGTFQASKGTAARMDTPHHGSGPTTQAFTLAPQPSQPVQTVQQMLAKMQSEKRARESLGGRQSPGIPSLSLGLTAMTDSVSSIGEGRARQAGSSLEGRSPMASPFADSLSSAKPFANSISRRYAMAGTSLGSGSSSNFTDFAGAQLGPADALRGSSSSPLHVKNSHRMAQHTEETSTSSDTQASEAAGTHVLSPRLEYNAPLMTRSRSLALPDDAELAASKRSASNRKSFQRGDTSSRSGRQLSLQAVNDDSGGSVMLRAQLQQQHKGEKAVQKRRLTKDQNIEPPKANWAGLSLLKDGAGDFVNSPKGGSGLIKVGLGFEDGGRKGC